MPGEHKPDCQCVACKAARKRAQAAQSQVIDPELQRAHERLAKDYEATLEEMKQLQGTLAQAQQQLDRADIAKGEQQKIIASLLGQRNETTQLLSKATDLLRSTSISHHRAEGHRGTINNCEDLMCREAAKAWFSIGELAGCELAVSDPDLWWEKKLRNEGYAMSFGDPGPLEPEDVAEGLASDDDEPELPPEPESHTVDASELDEVPDHPAFAGKRVKVLHASDFDPSDPGMPKKARV